MGEGGGGASAVTWCRLARLRVTQLLYREAESLLKENQVGMRQ
jgi:hypothetical protein